MHKVGTALLTAAMLTLAAPGQVVATSYEWQPLRELPSPNDIVGFANRHATTRSHWLNPGQIGRILTTGILHSKPTVEQLRESDASVHADGVFVTNNAVAYFWQMFSKTKVHLVDSKGRRCLIELPGDGIMPLAEEANDDQRTYLGLAAVAAAEIRWFFNDRSPSTGGSLRMTKEKVLRFLNAAKPVPCASLIEEANLLKDAWLTLPENQAKVLRTSRRVMNGNAIPRNFEDLGFFQAKGIIVTTRGDILFCNQWSDHFMELRNERGGVCVLRAP